MTHKDIFKDMTYDTLNKQVDGDHYKSMRIQPAHFINENKLQYAEGNAIKYICRADHKGSKIQDIQKAIHYLENELQHLTSLPDFVSFGSGDPVPYSVWDPEWHGQPDYATGFDR